MSNAKVRRLVKKLTLQEILALKHSFEQSILDLCDRTKVKNIELIVEASDEIDEF